MSSPTKGNVMAQMYLGSATRPTTARATDDVLLSRPEDIVADRRRKLLKNELPARKPVDHRAAVTRRPGRAVAGPRHVRKTRTIKCTMTGGCPYVFVKHWDGFFFEMVADRFWGRDEWPAGVCPAG